MINRGQVHRAPHRAESERKRQWRGEKDVHLRPAELVFDRIHGGGEFLHQLGPLFRLIGIEKFHLVAVCRVIGDDEHVGVEVLLVEIARHVLQHAAVEGDDLYEQFLISQSIHQIAIELSTRVGKSEAPVEVARCVDTPRAKVEANST